MSVQPSGDEPASNECKVIKDVASTVSALTPGLTTVTNASRDAEYVRSVPYPVR